MNIYVNGIPLEEVYYGIENSFCQGCAELELFHEAMSGATIITCTVVSVYNKIME